MVAQFEREEERVRRMIARVKKASKKCHDEIHHHLEQQESKIRIKGHDQQYEKMEKAHQQENGCLNEEDRQKDLLDHLQRTFNGTVQSMKDMIEQIDNTKWETDRITDKLRKMVTNN